MNELVVVKGNDIFTDSLVIANETGYEHSVIQRKIRDYEDDFKELGKIRFTVFRTENLSGGRPRKIYDLNEPQASFLLTMLDNRDKIRLFKLRLVKEFYRMRQFILERQTAEWTQSRLTGKKSAEMKRMLLLKPHPSCPNFYSGFPYPRVTNSKGVHLMGPLW